MCGCVYVISLQLNAETVDEGIGSLISNFNNESLPHGCNDGGPTDHKTTMV